MRFKKTARIGLLSLYRTRLVIYDNKDYFMLAFESILRLRSTTRLKSGVNDTRLGE